MDSTWKTNTNKLALFKRQIATLITAWRVHRSVQKLKSELAKRPDLDDRERKQRWETLHRKNAQLAIGHIRKYRGFLTKVGQSASTKTGELPQPWIEELSTLQDQLPVSPFKEVKQTVRKDLGKPFDDIFSDFEERPFASASVAQAHRAHLQDGRRTKVCVKVQHRGVGKLMSTDLGTVEYLCRKAAQYHPETPDMRGLVGEWKRATTEEIDFRLEAQNAIRAHRTLQRNGIDCGCAEPIEWCSGQRVLTMVFSEGWKITDLHRFPPGLDRALLGKELIRAFATLAFQEGLIHGDPHPGNIFVERKVEKPDELRPVLLDWGIVRQLTADERAALAQWAVATMSRDRNMYVSALRKLGFIFKDEFEDVELEDWMDASAWSLRDSIPRASQIEFMDELSRQREDMEEFMREESRVRGGKDRPDDSSRQSGTLVENVPGTVLFFLRGLELLQSVCGALEVSIQVAELILGQALPVLEKSCAAALVQQLPPSSSSSRLELAVRSKLKDLCDAGMVLGAQVCVVRDGSCATRGGISCSVAFGRAAHAGPPVTETTLMPLLDVGVGVLVLCFLCALEGARPTCDGLPLDTRISSLWPEFVPNGKGSLTLRQLLRHCTGLSRPFPRSLTFREYCSEVTMEEVVAESPVGDVGGACRVLGTVLAALLRRVKGHSTAAQALSACLKDHNLQGEIAYHAAEGQMAYLGRELVKELPTARILAQTEKRERGRFKERREFLPPWITWHELAGALAGGTDPLLVNREEMRGGSCCVPGRGLRGSARALCGLYAAVPPPECLEPRKVQVGTRAEWEEMGRCLEVAQGMQRLRFRRKGSEEDVFGYGYLDGATGSAALRVDGCSVAVLLNQVNEVHSQPAGHQVLSAVAAELGLEPAWHLDAPHGWAGTPGGSSAPLRSSHEEAAVKCLDGAPTNAAFLADGAPGAQPENDPCAHADERKGLDSLSGTWRLAGTDGIDRVLERFGLPPILASTLRRTLRIDVKGNDVSLSDTMIVAGQKVEDVELSFTVGHAFEAEQRLFGRFSGLATWTGPEGKVPERTMLLEKKVCAGDRQICLEERFSITDEGRLAVGITLRGEGRVAYAIKTARDRDNLCLGLEAGSLRLKKDVQLGKEIALRGGRIVGPEPVSLTDLSAIPVPSTVTVQYDDLSCTAMFDRRGGARRRREAAAVASSSEQPRCHAGAEAPAGPSARSSSSRGAGGAAQAAEAAGEADEAALSDSDDEAEYTRCQTAMMLARVLAAAAAKDCAVACARRLGACARGGLHLLGDALHTGCGRDPAGQRGGLAPPRQSSAGKACSSSAAAVAGCPAPARASSGGAGAQQLRGGGRRRPSGSSASTASLKAPASLNAPSPKGLPAAASASVFSGAGDSRRAPAAIASRLQRTSAAEPTASARQVWERRVQVTSNTRAA